MIEQFTSLSSLAHYYATLIYDIKPDAGEIYFINRNIDPDDFHLHLSICPSCTPQQIESFSLLPDCKISSWFNSSSYFTITFNNLNQSIIKNLQYEQLMNVLKYESDDTLVFFYDHDIWTDND